MSLSLLHANILSAIASSIYVVSLYLAQPKSKNGVPVSRDDPSVIKRRVLGVILGTIFNCLLVHVVLRGVSPGRTEHVSLLLSEYPPFRLSTSSLIFVQGESIKNPGIFRNLFRPDIHPPTPRCPSLIPWSFICDMPSHIYLSSTI